MKVLMLMWTETDAAGGTQADIDAWAEFDAAARQAGVRLDGGALTPPAGAKLVRPELAAAPPEEQVADGTFASGAAQIQAYYLLDCADEADALRWAGRLPTYGTVELRPLLEYDLG